MYTSLKIVKKLTYAWIYYPNGLTTGFAVSKGYFSADEASRLFQIVEQGKTKRPEVLLENISLVDETTGGVEIFFSSFADLQQKLTELNNPLMEIISDNTFTDDEIAAIQNSNSPTAINHFVTINDISDSLVDGITVSTGYTITGESITFNAGWFWKIDGIVYTNPIAVAIAVPYAIAGYKRFDKFALSTSNTFNRIIGDESNLSILEPELLPNTIQACMVLVTDGTIEEVTPPIVGEAFVKKLESQDLIIDYGTTIINQINLIDDRSSISIIGSATDVKSVQIPTTFIRPGKPHFFKNRTGHDVKLWHLAGTGNIKYFFPNGLDLIVKPNEVIEFNTNANDSAYVRFEYVGKEANLDDYYTKEEIDAKLPSNYSQIVYVNSNNPNTATIFDIANPPVTNDDLLKNDVDNLYIGDDSSNWVYNSATLLYETETSVNLLPIEVTGNQTVQESWNGKDVYFMGSGLLTYPNTGLSSGHSFNLYSDIGVTITWAIVAPKTWRVATLTAGTAPPSVTEGLFCFVSQRIGTNEIRVLGL